MTQTQAIARRTYDSMARCEEKLIPAKAYMVTQRGQKLSTISQRPI